MTSPSVCRSIFFSFLWAVAPVAADAQSDDPWNVLALLPLTGPESGQGDLAKKGIELALDDKDISSSLKIVFEDNGSEARKALMAYRSATTQLRFHAVLTIGSPAAMALAPVVNRDKIVLFALAATPLYTSADDYTYRIIGSAMSEAAFLVGFLNDTFRGKPLAILYQDNDYGVGTFNAFSAAASDGALRIVGEESFIPGSTNYRAQLLKLRTADPTIIYLSSWASDAGKIVRQLRQLNLDWTVICSQACVNPDLFASGGAAATGMVISAPSEAIEVTAGERFVAKYHEAITYVPIRFYRSLVTLAAAKQSCSVGTEPRSCLAQNRSDNPMVFHFDGNGEITEQYEMKTVANDRFVSWSNHSTP